jgi:endonuclease-8
MPEGDALRRAARRLQVLVGERVEAESPHPQGAATGVAQRIDGHTLESVTAHGKNLILRFDGGHVLRSHLRMNGRWTVVPRGRSHQGRPWLVLRGERFEARQWNGPVLELTARATRRLGRDILERPPRLDAMLASLRRDDGARAIGDALLDQRHVAGIGNLWKAEALWHAQVSPWAQLRDLADEDVLRVLDESARLMRAALDGGRPLRRVYRRAGRPCPRCGTAIASRGQGDDNRTAYWCPACQP